MNNLQSFLPINNQYSTIDINKLKANNFKLPILKRKTIEKSSILEISKYSNNLAFSLMAGSKDALIINSKELLDKKISIPSHSSIASTLMINANEANENGNEDSTKKNSILPLMNQRFLRSFTTLDIELAQNKNVLYEFKPKTLNSKILNKKVNKILEYSFFEMDSIISKPYFLITPENVIINLFYFIPKFNIKDRNFLDFNMDKLQGLSDKLSRYFKKPVKFDLTQLYSVSHNSQILINILGKLGLSRRNSFTRIIGRFLKNQSSKMMFRGNLNKFSRYATILTGVNIKLGGRLMKGKIVHRRKVKKIQYGSLARSKSNYITTARLTQKNKRGAFSFTVSIGHKIF